MSNFPKYLKVLIVIAFAFYSNKLYSQISWTPLQSGTSASIYSIYFLNGNTGWFCGSGGVISKTTNGGTNWLSQTSNCPNSLFAIYFVDASTGWAAGGYIDINTWGQVNIIKTTNGGVTWFAQKDEPSNYYYPQALYFFDASTGYASCYGNSGGDITGGLLKTTNGGTNWLMMPGSKPSRKTVFTNTNTAYSISKIWSDYNNIDTGMVYKTSNGGLNWSVSMSKYNYTFRDIQFFNQNTGILLTSPDSTGTNFRYFKTTDAGTTWSQISAGTVSHTRTFFTNEMNGWAADNNIYYTSNGGINWALNYSITGSFLNCITFYDSLNGWAGGYSGILLRTKNIDTVQGNYFPMRVGNVYKYFSWNFPYPNIGTYSKGRITRDTIAYGYKYYYCKGMASIVDGWVRYDSTSGLLLALSPGTGCWSHTNDKIIDSLPANVYDMLNNCWYGSYQNRRCESIFNTTLFGYFLASAKIFRHDGMVLGNVTYARNIGITSYGFGEPPPVSSYKDLVGGYINGVMYGDTIITNVMQLSTEVPSSHSLSQNYPNPFNQSTIFNVQCSMREHIIIKVYDLTGREIETLVDEVMNPGVYQLRFNGEGLTSGIYFYRMTAGDFTETRKMVLLK